MKASATALYQPYAVLLIVLENVRREGCEGVVGQVEPFQLWHPIECTVRNAHNAMARQYQS